MERIASLQQLQLDLEYAVSELIRLGIYPDKDMVLGAKLGAILSEIEQELKGE